MNNVMREEFELAWQIKGMDDEGNLGGKPTRSKIDDDKYAGEAAQFAWMWWKRSREYIVVQLPKKQDENACLFDFQRAYVQGYNHGIDACAKQLLEEGIKYE